MGLLLLILLAAIFYYLYRKGSFSGWSFNRQGVNEGEYYSVDHKYNAAKARKQKQIDHILDKINKKGMRSLSEKEKELLKEYSRSRI